MKKIKVNNLRFKSLMWWRSLSDDMKFTMVHNPSINVSKFDNVKMVGTSSIQVERMFKNWLTWEIEGGAGNEQ